MASVGRIIAVARKSTSASRRRFSALVSALDEFPGLPASESEPSKTSTATVSTLSNGATLVTEDAAAATTVTITYPGAGSAYEAVGEAGAALVNKCLSFKSGSGLSTMLIYRTLEDDGAIPFSSADRFGATVGFTAAPEKTAFLLPLLATDCSFERWDVRDAKKNADSLAEEAMASAPVVMTESLYAAAFGAQSPVGNPFYTSGASTSGIVSFRNKAYGMSGAVIAATGIQDHTAFAATVEERLSEAVAGEKPVGLNSAYVGGESRVNATASGFANVSIAFAAPESSALAAVVEKCLALGGLDAFSGPGLVGVSAGGVAGEAGSVVDAMCSVLTSVPSSDVIARAKGLAKAEAMFSLDEGSVSLAKIMTSSVLETGGFSAEKVAVSFDSITDAQVTAAYDSMLKSKPSMASVGDIYAVPYLATVESRFS